MYYIVKRFVGEGLGEMWGLEEGGRGVGLEVV